MGSENVHVPLEAAAVVVAEEADAESSSASSETTVAVVGVGVGVDVGVGAGVLLFLLFLASTDCGAWISAKMTRASTRTCLSLKWTEAMVFEGSKLETEDLEAVCLWTGLPIIASLHKSRSPASHVSHEPAQEIATPSNALCCSKRWDDIDVASWGPTRDDLLEMAAEY